MKKPIIDNRGFEDLMKVLEKRAKTFTPEWRMNREDPDPGTVLSSVFVHQVEETIERLNGSLDNYHRAFLNLLNPVPMAGESARVPVFFQTSGGYDDKVDLPKGFQVEGTAEGGDRLVYELEEAIHVYPNNVTEAYFVEGDQNKIYRGVIEDQSLLLDDENLQKNALYIHTGSLYHLNGPSRLKVALNLSNTNPDTYLQALVDKNKCRWSYYMLEEWHAFDVAVLEDGIIVLEKHVEGLVDAFNGQAEVRLEILEDLPFFTHLHIRDIGLISELLDWENVFEEYRSNEKNHSVADQKLRPFGERLSRLSTFDVVANDVLSKPGAIIRMAMDIHIEDIRGDSIQAPIDWRMIMRKSELARMQPQEVSVYAVEWQYYNGQGWQPLQLINENPRGFYKHQDDSVLEIEFICPLDMRPFEEESKRRYMIRAEIQRVENEHRTDGIYKVPFIDKVLLSYAYEGYQQVADVWIENGLEKENCKSLLEASDSYIRAFRLLSETEKAIYIPFEGKIQTGVMQLLWTLKFSAYKHYKEALKVEYGVYNGENLEWRPMKHLDETLSLSGTGLTKLYVDEIVQFAHHFGKDAVWLRVHSPHIQWHNLNGIYSNGVYARQQERIHNELLDTSSDTSLFLLEYEGILDLKVWVNELDTYNDKEIQHLIDSGTPCIYEQDALGHFTECWVMWTRTDTLLNKKSTDRVYLYDPLTEQLRFGDGRLGKKPPYGRSGLIRLSLTLSAGKEGNIESFKIDSLVTSRAFVQSVMNPSPGKGGAPRETVEQVMGRQHHQLKSRDRLIDPRDYEALLMGYFRNLHQVKCLSNTASGVDVKRGHFLLVVASHDPMKEQVTDDMKKQMLKMMEKRIPLGVRMNNIHLRDVALLTLNVEADIEVDNIKERHIIENRCQTAISAFLHHRDGNGGQGWHIGEHPDKSRFYKVLQKTLGVKNVQHIKIAYQYADASGIKELRPEQLSVLKDYLVVTGKHQIVVK